MNCPRKKRFLHKEADHILNEHLAEECLKFEAEKDKKWILYEKMFSRNKRIWNGSITNSLTLCIMKQKLINEKIMLILAFTGDGKCYMEYVTPVEKVISNDTLNLCTNLVRSGESLRVHKKTLGIILIYIYQLYQYIVAAVPKNLQRSLQE